MTRAPLSRSKSQRSRLQGAVAYCGGLPHSLLSSSSSHHYKRHHHSRHPSLRHFFTPGTKPIFFIHSFHHNFWYPPDCLNLFFCWTALAIKLPWPASQGKVRRRTISSYLFSRWQCRCSVLITSDLPVTRRRETGVDSKIQLPYNLYFDLSARK